MSANSAIGRELRNLHDVRIIHLRMREVVKWRGADDWTVKLVDQMGHNLVLEEAVIRNDDEYDMPVRELDQLLSELAVMILKANLKAMEQEQETHRQQLPWFLIVLAEVVYFKRLRGFRNLKRIVEDL